MILEYAVVLGGFDASLFCRSNKCFIMLCHFVTERQPQSIFR